MSDGKATMHFVTGSESFIGRVLLAQLGVGWA